MIQRIKSNLKNEYIEYLLKKGGVSFLFRILGMVLSFFNIWLISNFYNAAIYGEFSIIQTIILITTVFFTLGVQNVIVIELNSESNDKNKQLSIAFLVKVIKIILLVSIIPFLIFFFGNELISELFGNKNLEKNFEIIAVSIPFFLLHEVFLYYFIATKKIIKYGLFMFFLPNILFTIFIYAFKDLNLESFNITLYLCLSYVICFLLEGFLVFRGNSFKGIHVTKPVKQILNQSIPMMFSGIMVLLLNWTDVIMLGIMKSENEVGIYNAAFKVGFIVFIVISTINVVIVPKISEMFQKGDLNSLKKFINRSTQLVILVTLPIVLILIIFGKFILMQFGNEFVLGYPVLLIIVFSSFFSTFCGNVDQILNFTNNQSFLLKLNVILVLLNIFLNIFFIKALGIEGAALSSLISTAIFNIICVLYIKKKLGFYTFI